MRSPSAWRIIVEVLSSGPAAVDNTHNRNSVSRSCLARLANVHWRIQVEVLSQAFTSFTWIVTVIPIDAAAVTSAPVRCCG